MQKSRPTHGEPIKFYRDFTLLVSNWFHIGLQLTDTRVKAWRGGGGMCGDIGGKKSKKCLTSKCIVYEMPKIVKKDQMPKIKIYLTVKKHYILCTTI